jgi:hypothetical protein
MPRHPPDLVALQPHHRAGFPQFLVAGERVAQEVIGERIDRQCRRTARPGLL